MRSLFAAAALLLLAAAPPPEIRVEVLPITGSSYQLLTRPAPGDYRCTVAVVDPERNGIYLNAELFAKPGIPAETTKHAADWDVEFHVEIAKSSDAARTKVIVRRGGDIVARQSSTVRLAKPSGKPYKPAQ